MPRLSLQDLKERLRYDNRILRSLETDLIFGGAYRSVEDALDKRCEHLEISQAHMARAYLVGYRVPSLSGPDRRLDETAVVFDLMAGGNYPFTSPVAMVCSRPIPWSPHFNPQNDTPVIERNSVPHA